MKTKKHLIFPKRNTEDFEWDLTFREEYGMVPLSHSILHKHLGKVKNEGS